MRKDSRNVKVYVVKVKPVSNSSELILGPMQRVECNVLVAHTLGSTTGLPEI